MISKDVVDYIKSQLQKGQNKQDIINVLASSGWQMADIEEAFKYAQSDNSAAPAPVYSNISGGSTAAFLPGAGALLNEAWNLYRSRIKTFAGIIIIQMIAGAIVAVVAVILLYLLASSMYGPVASAVIPVSSVNGNFSTTASPAILASNISNFIKVTAVFIIQFLGLIIPLIIIQIWGQAAMLFAIKDSAENISAIEAYKRSWRKIGSLFWVGLLSGIIIFGGFMFFAIPGIIFAVWFSLASYIVVSENIGGMNAMFKSREYIRGKGWEVFGLLLVIFLIWVGIYVGVQFGTGILSAVFTAIGLGIVALILSFVIGVAFALFTPFMTVYSYLIYSHLREIKGDVAFEATTGKKIGYLAIGIIGILIGLGIFILPFLLLFRAF